MNVDYLNLFWISHQKTICNDLLHLQKFGVNNKPFLNIRYNKTSRVNCNSLDKLVFLWLLFIKPTFVFHWSIKFPRVEPHFSFFQFFILFFTRFFFLFNFWYNLCFFGVLLKRAIWWFDVSRVLSTKVSLVWNLLDLFSDGSNTGCVSVKRTKWFG